MTKNQDLRNRLAKGDQETVSQIKKSLKDFDDMISIEVPQVSFFEHRIKLQHKKARKEWWKELLAFIGTAAFILSFLFLSLFHQPEVFLTVQVLSVIFIGSYTFYVKRKVESSHE
ncbi:YxlC family protein [Peribacillus sp. NPDC097295]|uniref:YxlC family protein n=1 Tax=Peribacillus sp. NPDC097295 TaxID=3364402 RepID=UPI003810CFDC